VGITANSETAKWISDKDTRGLMTTKGKRWFLESSNGIFGIKKESEAPALQQRLRSP
jgi:hypothetical protein